MKHSTILITCVAEDVSFAEWLKRELRAVGFTIETRLHSSVRVNANDEAQSAIRLASYVIVLVSPDSKDARAIYQDVRDAQDSHAIVIPLMVRATTPPPVYIDSDLIRDFTAESQTRLAKLIQELPRPTQGLTFGEASRRYLNRASLKSRHTIDAYRRAIELFIQFLDENVRSDSLPVFAKVNSYATAADVPVDMLSAADAPLLLSFAEWMLSAPRKANTAHDEKRPYKASTVELRLSGVQNWLRFLDDHGWLPPEFSLAKAKRIVRDEMRGQTRQDGPPQPPDHIEELIYFYDNQSPPAALKKHGVDPERIERWELTRLRNRALMHTLAETGGRISEVLSLNLADFPARNLERNEVLRVQVTGKGGHDYYLRFLDSLPAIRSYIAARGSNLKASVKGDVPMFVSHAPRFDGSRMSRVVAWRVVQQASKALGLHRTPPHDFRHWRATQLINAGHSLDVVQEYLGHRSVETTRAYYAHTDPLRVDDAVRNTGLPDPHTPE